jgi:hypothetical protein
VVYRFLERLKAARIGKPKVNSRPVEGSGIVEKELDAASKLPKVPTKRAVGKNVSSVSGS